MYLLEHVADRAGLACETSIDSRVRLLYYLSMVQISSIGSLAGEKRRLVSSPRSSRPLGAFTKSESCDIPWKIQCTSPWPYADVVSQGWSFPFHITDRGWKRSALRNGKGLACETNADEYASHNSMLLEAAWRRWRTSLLPEPSSLSSFFAASFAGPVPGLVSSPDPPSYEEKRSGEPSLISWASARFCDIVT